MPSTDKRILWLSHNIPYPPKTGVLQRNYNLIREASEFGSIHLLAVAQTRVLPIAYNMEEVRRELGRFCERIEIVELPIDRSAVVFWWTVLKSFLTRDPFSVNWVKFRGLQERLAKMITSTRFDVVHFDTISLDCLRPAVGDLPSVMNHHNIESELIIRRSRIERNPLKRLYYRLEGRKLRRYESERCGAYDVNFTVSDLDRSLLLERVPGCRVEVIPNGVDTDYFRMTEGGSGGCRLIFAAGMNWYPNRDAVLFLIREVWPLLSESLPDASLTIVGAHPPDELRELASRDRRVEVTGFVDDVRDYFARADICVCPMRDGGGTRLKILDALSQGTPLVSTTMGCEGIDVVPEQQVLLADTPAEFVRQIGRLCGDPELYRSVAANGRRFVEKHYSWKVIGERLRAAYGDILRARGRDGSLPPAGSGPERTG